MGPGLDGKRDEAMFILIEMKLPQPYQVVLFDDESVVTARSAQTNRIYNRLYIGQFEELRHLKDGTLIKAIPCSRVFSFVDKIDKSLFTWECSEPLRNTDFLKCNLIFTLRFDLDKNNWNHPFKNVLQGNWNPLIHVLNGFYRDIIIEWGIHIHTKSICPSGVRSLDISEVLTKEVKDDLIKYTCSSACGNDTNICDNAHKTVISQTRFYPFLSNWNRSIVKVLGDMFLTINDLKVEDSCEFNTSFYQSTKFCDSSWASMQTVQVSIEIQHAYPQFITIPELYKENIVRIPITFVISCGKVLFHG